MEGSDSSYVSDDNAVLSGDDNIVAPPESFSGRTEYVMSPDLHMPVPLPPPINGHTDDETGMESEIPPTVSAEELYQAHSPMEFTPRDFLDSFNLPDPQNRLSIVSKMLLNLKYRVYHIYYWSCDMLHVYLFFVCVIIELKTLLIY